MNLIEQLGGYERAKHEFEMIKDMKPIYPAEIETNDRLLLEYRRQHNIFEVGDKVVWINSIAPNDTRLFEIEESLGEKPDAWSLRHATDEEIKAGKRLEVKSDS